MGQSAVPCKPEYCQPEQLRVLVVPCAHADENCQQQADASASGAGSGQATLSPERPVLQRFGDEDSPKLLDAGAEGFASTCGAHCDLASGGFASTGLDMPAREADGICEATGASNPSSSSPCHWLCRPGKLEEPAPAETETDVEAGRRELEEWLQHELEESRRQRQQFGGNLPYEFESQRWQRSRQKVVEERLRLLAEQRANLHTWSPSAPSDQTVPADSIKTAPAEVARLSSRSDEDRTVPDEHVAKPRPSRLRSTKQVDSPPASIVPELRPPFSPEDSLRFPRIPAAAILKKSRPSLVPSSRSGDSAPCHSAPGSESGSARYADDGTASPSSASRKQQQDVQELKQPDASTELPSAPPPPQPSLPSAPEDSELAPLDVSLNGALSQADEEGPVSRCLGRAPESARGHEDVDGDAFPEQDIVGVGQNLDDLCRQACEQSMQDEQPPFLVVPKLSPNGYTDSGLSPASIPHADSVCLAPNCQKPTWNGQPNEYCSRICEDQSSCIDQNLLLPTPGNSCIWALPVCPAPHCQKPSWNGEPNEYCSKSCRNRCAVSKEMIKGSLVRIIGDFDPESYPRALPSVGWEGIVLEVKENHAAVRFDQLESSLVWVKRQDFGKLKVIKARFEGDWTANAHHCCIRGNKIIREDRMELDIDIIGSTTLKMTLSGNDFQGELKVDGRIHWSNGDVWIRAQAAQTTCAKAREQRQLQRVAHAESRRQVQLHEAIQNEESPFDKKSDASPGLEAAVGQSLDDLCNQVCQQSLQAEPLHAPDVDESFGENANSHS